MLRNMHEIPLPQEDIKLNKRIVSGFLLTALALTISAIPAAALEGVPKRPNADFQITNTMLPPGEFDITGVMEYHEVEGGYYGFMVKRVQVVKLMREVVAGPSGFKQLTFDGKFAKLDQGAEIIDGVLMVPLRAVVEGLGGKVQWDDATRSVTVEMSDRMAYFCVGQEQAEMNQNNVRYIARNMIAMDKAPIIINGRTMISADAITQILGLYGSPTLDDTSNIVAAR